MNLFNFLVFSILLYKSESVNSERIQLSCKQIKQFVDGHNVRRQKVARGAVPPQPAAANMLYMVWDEELAEKAVRRAENGIFSNHVQLKTIGTRRWSQIGENLYINYFPEPSSTPNIKEVLEIWFNEHNNYGYEKYGPDLPRNVGHYTQMVWAESTHLGCGITQKKEDSWTITTIVCHYAPAGNVIGRLPYRSNGAAGQLRCVNRNCERPYGTNCKK